MQPLVLCVPATKGSFQFLLQQVVWLGTCHMSDDVGGARASLDQLPAPTELAVQVCMRHAPRHRWACSVHRPHSLPLAQHPQPTYRWANDLMLLPFSGHRQRAQVSFPHGHFPWHVPIIHRMILSECQRLIHKRMILLVIENMTEKFSESNFLF